MSTKEKIMDAAEGYIRTRGFNSFSFRDIAADIGIKSASVHYHFATKGALGEAVTNRYRERNAEILGNPQAEDTTVADLVDRFIGIYRTALNNEKQMCLCGMLGAEIDSLSEPIKGAVRRFFSTQENWLAMLLTHANPGQSEEIIRARARSTIAALQGALMMSRAQNEGNIFEDVAGRIRMGLVRH